jgi:hypothetical protein
VKTRTRNDNAKASNINAKASGNKVKIISMSVKARNIVFRFIIEYGSLRDFGYS